jgi:maltoporin
MNIKTKWIAALFLGFAAQSAMAETNFNGYLRSGLGTNSKGGTMDCYSVNANKVNGNSVGHALAAGDIANAGRLGQECGTYGELQFGTSMGEVEGTKFGVQTMMATGVGQLADWESMNPGFRQAYTTATGFGHGAFAKSTVWVGKRYYDRHDVHIVDFFWMADTGPGAGIENIDVGAGKFSYALLRNGDSNQSTVENHDFRLQGIDLGGAGSLGIGGIIARGNNSDAVNAAISAAGVKKDGSTIWVSFAAKPIAGVSNNIVFQTSTGAANMGGNSSTGTGLMVKNDQWRIFDSINFEAGDHVNGAAFIAYGKADQTTAAMAAVAPSYTFDPTTGLGKAVAGTAAAPSTNTKTTDTSFVIRPVYHFDELYSLAVEAGQTTFAQDGATTNQLTKVTIAPQMSMGSGFYARPVLRAYVTMANWNQGGGGTANGSANTSTSGTSYGVQMEAWW